VPRRTSEELPSQFCKEAEYASKATFPGFEERIGCTSVVLGGQLSTTDALATVVEGRATAEAAQGHGVEALEVFHKNLRLRLGYWPSTSFDDARARTLDWQAKFEESCSDKRGFATFVHCLLDGAAEYAWLQE